MPRPSVPPVGPWPPMIRFSCDACGACCRNLQLAAVYRPLDRGDGTCRHFDEHSNLCRIYEDRPPLCRVEEQFQTLFAATMTFDQYVEATMRMCVELKRITPQPNPEKGKIDVPS